MDLRPDQTARRGESWRTPSTPRQNRPKVMRSNDRPGDSYRSLAPGLCGRRASRDVSAQDLHDLCTRTNASRLVSQKRKLLGVRFYQKLSLVKHAGKTSHSVSTIRQLPGLVRFTVPDHLSHPSRPGGHIPNHRPKQNPD